MKKTSLLIGIFLLTLNIYGQDNQIEFGIKGGLNYSSFIDNNDDDIPADYTGKIGFHLGGFVKLPISERILIKPELIYSQQGSNFSTNGSNYSAPDDVFIRGGINGKINESLVLIPIILEYKLNKKLSLEFGPQFGLTLNREIEYENSSFDQGFLKNDDKETFEFGIGLGLGYSISSDLGISLRYNYGIIERQNLKTSVIQLGMNYKL
ncbi:porin family protein [Algibacter sp. L1A34]|uniref:porin family protein n=1 Tax=Algibacter sp. L1A34 TaxID=2686365 RepID=UPI00131BF991|nr:porin family protein [Algibacter sp. L1A34]